MTFAWRLEGVGAETLALRAHEPAPLGPFDVRVRMQAAAINHRDLGIAAGAYPNLRGVIPFSDGAGSVVEVGSAVDTFSPGDLVITSFYPDWQSGPASGRNHRRSLGCEMDGVLAHEVVLPAAALVRAPRTLSPQSAATLPCAGLTAWSALFTEGQLQPGQTVLVQGTGGVALFAVQLARLIGARPIVITGDEAKAERVQALGATTVINYRQYPDWAEQVLNATDGEGADVIVELGGQETLPRSLECIKVGGRISVVGVLSGLVAPVPLPPILFRHVHLNGITVGPREDLEKLCQAVDANGLQPVIDRTFAFDEVPAAYASLPLGRHFGKLVVTIAD